MIVAFAPFDDELSAQKLKLDFAVGLSVEHAGDARGAGARAAGERFARAAFPYAHFDVRADDDLHEFNVRLARKNACDLEARALGEHGSCNKKRDEHEEKKISQQKKDKIRTVDKNEVGGDLDGNLRGLED